MRQKTQTIAAALAVAFLVGCSTLYDTTVTITQVVDAGMKDWSQMSAAGKTTPAIDAAVVKAHDQYRAACAVAQTALINYKASGNNADYVSAIVAVRASVDSLFDLITPLLTPAKASTLQSNLKKATVL
jgi:hypothetical protein